MARKRSPARLVVALSVAAVLAVFLIYTAIAGGTPSLRPSQLAGHSGRVSLTGMVVGRVAGDAHQADATCPRCGTPRAPRDRYNSGLYVRSGRDVLIEGRLKDGVFVAYPGTLVTKCPSKYSPKKS